MLTITITETKQFIKKLLLEPVFDSFLFVHADVISDVAYSIDGKLHPAFFDTEELSSLPSADYAVWARIRSHVCNILRGKKPPLRFKIILILSEEQIVRLIEQHQLPPVSPDIATLSFNIYYNEGNITVTALASSAVFPMDKTLEHLWDDAASAFFKQQMIV